MEVQPHLLNLSAYINQNLDKDLPLSSLAKRVGLSPFHFHRKFGAYFGESLHQHIKRLRLERAAYALVHGSTPVRQIARDSGYKTVSAFSHAFSGFAGESPTRYRSTGAAKLDEVVAPDTMTPAWVGELPPQEFAFVRAMGTGRGAQRSIRDAIDLITSRVGSLPSTSIEPGAESGADDDRFAFIAATSDLYGVSNNGDFRLDVGLDAKRLPAERVGALGVQTLPGGRYARFDFTCTPADAIDQCLRAALHGLKKPNETPRLSQYYLRFDGEQRGVREAEALRDYQFFVPLAD
jgi:AraC-like DNA-binding protein